MALKDIFTMVKADRYTADGREEVIKAREAEIEDVKYNNGDISQKTGLMKTPNGWVKPPKGRAPGAKKQEEPKNVHGAEVDKIYERQLKRIKELKAKGFTDEQIDNDKIIKQTKEDMKNVGKKPAAENKTTIRQGPKTKTLDETPAEHIKKNWDYYAEPGRYGQEDMEQLVLSPSGYKETDSYSVMGGGKRVQYEKEGGEKIALFFDKDGGLDDYEIEGPGNKPDAADPDAANKAVEKKSKKPTLGEMAETGHVPENASMATLREIKKNALKIYPQTENTRNLYIEAEEKLNEKLREAYAKKHSTDSAPRILTGDTKIRVRKA